LTAHKSTTTIPPNRGSPKFSVQGVSGKLVTGFYVFVHFSSTAQGELNATGVRLLQHRGGGWSPYPAGKSRRDSSYGLSRSAVFWGEHDTAVCHRSEIDVPLLHCRPRFRWRGCEYVVGVIVRPSPSMTASRRLRNHVR